MDLSRMSQGQQIAAAGGALLIISLFLPWIGDLNGWESNSTTDLYLLITAVIAIGAAVGLAIDVPGITMNGATALLGSIATLLLIWLLVFDFPEGADRGIGLILALLASGMVAYGGFSSGR